MDNMIIFIKRWILAFSILLSTISLCACETEDSVQQSENNTTMKLKITIGEESVTATLSDNATTDDFVTMLPLTLTLEDYAGKEKVSNLSRELTTKGVPDGYDPEVGDITYYAPWGNLAIFYKDFGYASGLIKLGEIEGDMSLFNSSEKLKATFELIE
jgi:hypothetical protein